MQSSAPAHAAPAAAAPRRIYAYSVVPGGVSDRHELAQAIKSDAVVAAHYAGFKVEAARPFKLDKARAVYVSYRKGEQIYWTRHKVMLEPGEVLLSDGTHDLRARCANRISDVAQLPVAADEPAAELLDSYTDGSSEDAAVQALSAEDSGEDAAQPSFRLATFSSGASLAAAGPRGYAYLSSPPGAAGDSMFGSTGGRSGSAGWLSAGRTRTAEGEPAEGSSSLPSDGVQESAPSSPAEQTPPQVLPSLPGVTPALPDGHLSAGESPVLPTIPSDLPDTGPLPGPVAGPVAMPIDIPLIDPAEVPGPDGERQLAPLDPDRPRWLPPQQPAEPIRPLPHGEIPEPGSIWLLGAAAAAMVWLRRRRTLSPAH